MHTQNNIAFRFRTLKQRVKAVIYRLQKKPPKLIGYHSNILGLYHAICVSFIIPIYTSTNAEIFGGIC